MQTAQLFFFFELSAQQLHNSCQNTFALTFDYTLEPQCLLHFLYQVLCHVANLLFLVEVHCVLPPCSSRSCKQQPSAEPPGLNPHTASGGWDLWLVLVPQCLLHPPCCLHPLHLMQLGEAFCCCISIWTGSWYLNPLLICQNCVSMSSRSVYPQ